MVNESEVKEHLSRENRQFRKLMDRHQELDLKIKKIDRRRTLTPQEELHLKQLRVEKLHAKDRMEQILRENDPVESSQG
jgi:uncharacterized protein